MYCLLKRGKETISSWVDSPFLAYREIREIARAPT